MKKTIKFLLFLLIIGVLLAPFFGVVKGADLKDKEYGAKSVYQKSLLSTIGLANKETPLEVAQFLVQMILGFVGIILFGLILYAGFIWIKARDNTNEVEKANSIIENCIYGVVIISLAYGISEFIFSRLIGF